ncbi:MAG: AraC family transcriptional regulator [Planctomycetia bacterium]|nr:AraC family transcriptional regulator [Planctomycetia bacterium]
MFVKMLDMPVISSIKDTEITDPVLLLAVQMIREKACQGLSVNDLTQATGLPRRTLERRFQRQLNTSPHYEILRTQIQAARKLLQESHLRLREIADATGFRSVSHLCVAMKRVYKQTPNEVRHARS